MRAPILFLLLTIVGCNPEPAPTATASQTSATVAEPAAPSLEPEAHALDQMLPDVLPASVNAVVATANPAELVKVAGIEGPPGASGIYSRVPELRDLHPSRLEVYGFDPARPAGLFVGEAEGSWGLFAYIENVDKTLYHMNAKEAPALPDDAENVKRYRLSVYTTTLTVVGDLAVIAHDFTVARGPSLSADQNFQSLSQTLDTGGLLTAYTSEEAPAILGLARTETGFALRSVSATEASAETSLAQWTSSVFTREFRLVDLLGQGVLAALFGEPSEKQLAKDKKLRKAFDEREDVRAKIDDLRRAPAMRRQAALDEAVGALTATHSDRQKSGELHMVTQFFETDDAFAAKLFEKLDALAQTDAEKKQLSELRQREQKLDSKIGGMSQSGVFAALSASDLGFDSKLDDAAIGGLLGSEVGEMQGGWGLGTRGTGRGGGGTGEGSIGLGSIGTIGHGSGTGSGGMGRIDFGKSRPQASAKLASASDPLLRKHASKRVTRVKRCYNQEVRGGNDFVGTVTATASIANGRVTVSKVTGPASLGRCVRMALQGAVDTEETANGTVSFRMTK